MLRPISSARLVLAGILMLAIAGRVRAQEARSTGLPKKVQWTFNFDAGLGAFGFAHSLYTNVRPDPSGQLGDNWAESFIKPAISGDFALGKSELYAKLSAVGERTFATPPSLVGAKASSFQVEDAYLGWRSGKALGMGENALDLTVGRTQYKIGHGMILWDGGGEGGSRGGFWSNARKAWQFAGIARLNVKHSKLEAFYLDRDEVPESETGTRLWGANYELTLGSATTLGASYLKFIADTLVKPLRDKLNVYNLRAYTAPLKRIPELAFEAEYVREENGQLLASTAWTAQASYELAKVTWKPRISYRYAFFQGDDLKTTKNEGFDMLLPGFYDWGTWWQGEIAGEYFLANSNLISHQVRVHLTPSEAVGAGLIGYNFLLDQPDYFGTPVTSKDLATELDGYTDWKVNQNFLISFLAAIAHPRQAAIQAAGRTDNFYYGMIYVTYSY